jgi:hypothetical protein
MKTYQLIFSLLFGLFLSKTQAQNATTSSGGNANGIAGSSSYCKVQLVQ